MAAGQPVSGAGAVPGGSGQRRQDPPGREPPSDELSIGAFSRRCRLPVSTLRYYHEIGVLAPARVDASSGYRYYRSAQLELAELVHDLRRLGLPPAEIAQVTAGQLAVGAALDAHRRRLTEEIADRARAVERIDKLVANLGPVGPYPVHVEPRVATRCAALSGPTVSASAGFGVRRLIVGLRAQLRTAAVGSPAFFGARFPLDLASDPVDTVVYADLGGPVPAQIATTDLPGGEYAVASHRGHGPLSAAYAAVLDWVAQHGRDPSGTVLEEYHPAHVTTVAVGLRPLP